MKLPMFSVVGESLNFGLRRMETIMRVAWLPVVLSLVFNMASVFAVLSVANKRLITFADLAQGVPYQRAVQVSAQALEKGLLTGSHPMWMIYTLTLLFNLILVASFLAPLIRFAGLGERPSPGIFKLAFGPDQIRFIMAGLLGVLVTVVFVYAPVGAAAYWVLKYVLEALSQTYVSFPDPNSLHTISLVEARDVLAERGALWQYLQGAPLAAAAAFGAALWLILIVHFRPSPDSNRSAPSGFLGRAITTLVAVLALTAIVWFAIHDADSEADISLSWLIAVGILIAEYFSLRMFPYAGIAVCRKSFAPAGLLRVTRRWNILRLFVIVVSISIAVLAVQFVVNRFAFSAIALVINTLFSATSSATKLVNSGEAAPWVLPMFIWIWNGLKIIANIFLLFFSYGVLAGLLGRLYRESERET